MLLYVLYTIKQFLLGNFTCIKLILTTCILLELNHPLKFIIFLLHIPVYCNISLPDSKSITSTIPIYYQGSRST